MSAVPRTKVDLESLKPGAHIHLMGICGTAMASMAGLLRDRGFQVTGSDTACYPPMSDQLAELKIEVKDGYKKENLIPAPDLVIVGNVIQKKFEESAYLLTTDIPYTSFPEAMGEMVIRDLNSMVICGTHGKTTTTSMTAWVMHELGLQPGFLIGGIAKNFPNSFRDGKGDWFVIEGDEYDTAFFAKVPKFLYYKPKYATITSVEFDHADIYRDLEHVKDTFRQLFEVMAVDGHLVAYADCENVADVIKEATCRVHTYGLQRGDYRAENIEYGTTGTCFDLMVKSQKIAEVEFPMSGEHNVLNVLSVLTHAHQLGWDIDHVVKSLAGFQGVRRRQEIIGQPDDVLVIEDFAHHPTAVEKTLSGLKKQYREREIFAVFEPRSATSRRRVFQQQYAQSFEEAAHVLIASPYDQSSIAEEDRFSVEELVGQLNEKGVQAGEFAGADEIVAHLNQHAPSGSLVVIMSNGGFDRIYSKLLDSLESRSGR